MSEEPTIEKKCIGCFDRGIINIGTPVEEPCPICQKDSKENSGED